MTTTNSDVKKKVSIIPKGDQAENRIKFSWEGLGYRSQEIVEIIETKNHFIVLHQEEIIEDEDDNN